MTLITWLRSAIDCMYFLAKPAPVFPCQMRGGRFVFVFPNDCFSHFNAFFKQNMTLYDLDANYCKLEPRSVVTERNGIGEFELLIGCL